MILFDGSGETGRVFFFLSSRRRHTRWNCDWSSDVCSSDLEVMAADQPGQPLPEPAGDGSMGMRLAWGVLVAVLIAFDVQGVNNVVLDHDGLRRGVLLIAGYVLATALQLRHSRAARQGTRPRAWPLTLAVQVVLA